MTPRPLKVAALITDVDGSSMARCFTAYNYLETHGKIEMLTKWEIFNADVVVLHRHWMTDTQTLVKRLQGQGIRVVADCDDDYFNVPRGNPAWHEHQQPLVRHAIKRVLKQADRIFVSTQNLSEKCTHFSDSLSLVPNSLDLDLWRERDLADPSAGRPLTIGFAGSVSHRADLDLLRGVLGPLMRRYGSRLRLAFLGTAPEWLAAEIGPEAMRRTRFVPLVPVTSFPKALCEAGFDIGLAPLLSNPFNEARSHLKLLEYSAAGAVTVASPVGPFQDPALPLAAAGPRPKDWIAALVRLIDDPGARRDLAEKARQYVRRHDVGQLAGKTLEALEATAPDRSRTPLRRTPEPFEPTRNVTVIMPVHDAPELTRNALAAVLPELGETRRLLVVDDGSQRETFEVLATTSGNPFVRVFSREKAQGFVASVNFGIRQCPDDDVILLNSDTWAFTASLTCCGAPPQPPALWDRHGRIEPRLDRLTARPDRYPTPLRIVHIDSGRTMGGGQWQVRRLPGELASRKYGWSKDR